MYNLLLVFGLIFIAPKIGLHFLKGEKYRKNLKPRFGLDFPSIEKGQKKLLWVHAVSLGETKAITTLVKKIKREFPDLMIVCSSITETGHAEAQKALPEADAHVYLPLDFSWIISPITHKVRPDIVLVSETDLWYNFLCASKNVGASIYLVNGKLSERSLRNYKRFFFFSRKLFGLIDRFCLQSVHYKERFLELGISEEKLAVTGNMKLDGVLDTSAPLSRKDFGISEKDQVIVIGSTHDPEEKKLLHVMKRVWKEHPDTTVILVPRHPERFNEVAQILQKEGLSFCRYTENKTSLSAEKVLLVDAMGVLKSCYAIADLAIVAGSYTETVGGHNIVEPCIFGVPTIFGPYMHSQPELVDLVKYYGSGMQLSLKELPEALIRLLMAPRERKVLGDAGKKLVEEQSGATEKTYEFIFSEKKEKKGCC